VPLKKHLNFIIAIFLTITLSNCKKDCNGSYTIEGTLWNGTKNQPRKGILVKAVAGRGNSLFSGGSNVRDAGNARTDENGYFKIVYNCIGDDMTGISLSSSDLPYSGISNDDRLPINQDYKRTYNIPDSVSLNINFSTTNGLGNSDTFYVYIGIPDNIQRLVFTKDIQPNGFYKRFRIRYQDAISMKYTIGYNSGIGYATYKANLLIPVGESMINNIIKLEPEVNDITINY
jgi:hypothetical protein